MKKRIILIILTICVVVFIGINVFNKNKVSDNLSNKLSTASQQYFEKYVSANDSTNMYTVTLKNLNDVKDAENYDLKGLENCNETQTKAEITINYKTGKPKNIKTKLKC